MADPKKAAVKSDDVKSVNPRGAENNPQFDKATEHRDNQLADETGGGNATLPAGTVRKGEEGKGSVTGTVRTQVEGDKGAEGFVAFRLDMVQLSELYGNMRDGNYFSAFRIAVEILHANLVTDPRAVRGTPTQRANARIAARANVPVKRSQVMELEQKLTDCCDDLEKEQGTQLKTGSKEAVRASQEKNVGKVDVIGLIALVRMILQLFKDNN